jgi:hypothetical protein
MLELRDYARAGPLQRFFTEPSRWFRAENGVFGIALSYDEALVREVEHSIVSGLPRGTVEHSALVARVLAGITGTGQYSGDASLLSIDREYDDLFLRWQATNYRRYGRHVKPVIIEVTVGPEFPRYQEYPPEPFFEDHRIIYRRVRESVLHYAESGGRFIPERARRWGTLGGFLETFDAKLYAVSAAHVLEKPQSDWPAVGTPAFRAAGTLGLQALFQFSLRWSRESGRNFSVSTPIIVPELQCSLSTNPNLPGLDVALASWPSRREINGTVVDVAGPGDFSQVLPSWFLGASSGMQRIHISNLSIWHSYQLPGKDEYACVSDCLQIKLRDRPYFRSNVSKGGDSGAWLIANGISGHVWLGLLLGGDGDRAGVVPASRIVSHFQITLGPLRARLS